VSKDVYVEGEAPEPDKTDANRHSKTSSRASHSLPTKQYGWETS
jgi:hypothetical protein